MLESKLKLKQKNQPIARSGTEDCDWLIHLFLLLTRQSSFHKVVSDGFICRMLVFASDSVGLIFTKSYSSVLLIMTLRLYC